MSWIDPLRWLEALLRSALWRLESRLALVTIAALVLLITVAIIWWDSSDEVRNFGLIAAAVIALPLAIWRSRVSERQAETAHQTLLDERFNRAVDWLLSPHAGVRGAAILTLRQLAEDYPDRYALAVITMLTSGERLTSPEVDDDDEALA